MIGKLRGMGILFFDDSIIINIYIDGLFFLSLGCFVGVFLLIN